MASSREYIELIDKFIELTQHNKISWEREIPAPNSNLLATGNKINLVYSTEYKTHYIRAYKEAYKHFTDENDFCWGYRLVLEFVDQSGNSLWRFPEINNIAELLNAIKYKDANVDNLLKEILD